MPRSAAWPRFLREVIVKRIFYLLITICANLSLSSPANTQDRTTVVLPIVISNIGAELDRRLIAKGRSGSCSSRLYWVGPTRITGQTGQTLHFTSRARYEQYACGVRRYGIFGPREDVRIFRDTKRLDANVGFVITDSEIAVRGELTNIRNFPNDLENILRNLFNIDFAKVIKIVDRDTLAQNPILNGIEPQIDSVRVARGPGSTDVTLSVSVSFLPLDLTRPVSVIADAIRNARSFALQWAQ